MKKVLLALVALSLVTACERAESEGSFEQQQKNEQLKKSSDSTKAYQSSAASETDTTDPKDIIVPPRH